MTTFATWLKSLDTERLHDILTQRPDAAVHFDDPLELSYALESERSVRRACDRLSMAELQALEAILALGSRASTATLAGLLANSGAQHEEAVASAASALMRAGLVWPDEGRLHVVSGVAKVFTQPLDADGTLSGCLSSLGVTDLRRMLAAHGHPRSVDPRPALEAILLANLSDPDWVRRHVTSAEPEVCEPILALAKGGSTPPDASDFSDPADYDDYEHIAYGASYLGTRWGRAATRREVFAQHPMAVEWASEHGIVFASRNGYMGPHLQMPAEVALALRGSGYRAPFTPVSPEAVVGTVEPAAVEASAGFAAAEFAQQAGAVLDTLARCPWPLVKSGGVALRELDRLAAAALVTPSAARLSLELADHAGLLMRTGSRLQTSPAFPDWRGREAAERYAALVAAWWDLPFAPSATSTAHRKTVRPLERAALCDPCDPSRHSLVQAMAALPIGSATELAPLEATLRWRQPRIELPVAKAGSGWALAWAEATALGVLAAGALSELGRRLQVATVPSDLVQVIAAMVPANTDAVSLGSDLTAVVLGSPSDRLRLLLDSVADRDSTGSAMSWRFTPKSVRRALDDGADVATLQAHLESVAAKELPHTLRYLLKDVARRHGELRLSAQGTLIRGLDEPKVAEVFADSSLRALGLRRLAPTILTTRSSVDETLTALRRAGYYPIPEGNAGEWLDLAETG